MSVIVGSNLTSTTGVKSVVTMLIPADASRVTVSIDGTFTATLIAEVSNDGGATWNQPATVLAQSGLTIFPVGGLTHFRVRCTAYTSGNAGVNLNAGPEGGPGGVGAANAFGILVSHTITGGEAAAGFAAIPITWPEPLVSDAYAVSFSIEFISAGGAGAADDYFQISVESKSVSGFTANAGLFGVGNAGDVIKINAIAIFV